MVPSTRAEEWSNREDRLMVGHFTAWPQSHKDLMNDD